MFSWRSGLATCALLLLPLIATAQTSAQGWVTVSGSLLGPIYPCGNNSCPTYDSGQVQIAVNGYSAAASYSRAGGQKTSQQIANALAAKLNVASSSVTATLNKTKITLTSKLRGSSSNYPVSTSVTHCST